MIRAIISHGERKQLHSFCLVAEMLSSIQILPQGTGANVNCSLYLKPVLSQLARDFAVQVHLLKWNSISSGQAVGRRVWGEVGMPGSLIHSPIQNFSEAAGNQSIASNSPRNRQMISYKAKISDNCFWILILSCRCSESSVTVN